MPVAALLISLVLTALVLTGCERRTPSGSGAVRPAGAVDGPTPPVAAEAPTLRDELAPFFRLIQQGDLGAARVRLRRHLDQHPGDGQAEFLFGLSYHQTKAYAKARPWFEAALEHEPAYFITHYFLGWCLYYLGEPEASRQAFLTHLGYQPEEADTHFALALLDLDDDELDAAEAGFRRAIQLQSPDRQRSRGLSKAHARLGDVMIRRGDFEQARAELILATELYPDHYEAFYKLYRVELRLGHDDAAAQALASFRESRARLYPTTSFPE